MTEGREIRHFKDTSEFYGWEITESSRIKKKNRWKGAERRWQNRIAQKGNILEQKWKENVGELSFMKNRTEWKRIQRKEVE